MEELKTCPICESPNYSDFLTTRDHFLTQEEFTIVQCLNCTFRFTNPRPGENEISRYYESDEYISHDTSQLSLLQTIYSISRNFTLRNKYNILKKYANGVSLLDIGCGTGEFLNFCRKKRFSVTGIEPNEKARNFAIRKHQLNVSDEQSLGILSNKSYDIVTMWHVLEHVHKLNERWKTIHDLLLPGGSLIIAVPNCDSWDARKYREFWAAYDLPRHLYHFTPASMKFLAEKNGFIIEKILPMKLDSFYISLLSEKYRTGLQNFLLAFFNGIRSNIYARKNNNNYSSLIYICKTA